MMSTRPLVFATWFGVGRLPLAPGTFAAFSAIPLHWGLELLPFWLHALFIIVLVVVGAQASHHAALELHEDDPTVVVIDEAAGALVTLLVVRGADLIGELASVLAFRVLDILKPWPINIAERWKPTGLGIMADDVVAALIAGCCVTIVLTVARGVS